jgi:hypothetical protein
LDNPSGFAKEYGPGKLALQGGSLALSAFEPPMPKPYIDPDTGKYKGPQGQLNLSDKFDTGLRLVAEGGYIDGYATGGTIQSGGIRDLYGTPDNQPTISPGLSGFGLGRLNNLAGEQAMTQAQTLGYAEGGDVGGDVSNYRQDQAALNLDQLPSLNVNTGEQTSVDSRRFPFSFGNAELDTMMNSKYLPSYGDAKSQKINPLYTMGRMVEYSTNPKLRDQSSMRDYVAQGYNKGELFMARGGYLDGQGDGMSDSIPATIEGKQPARLADGEFVIPADVVSHIGNGSSKAGSKRLYAMLDKVRHARTGNKKQGKEIKADKYLPA